MASSLRRYLPALLLVAGCLGLLKTNQQVDVPLRASLNSLPGVLHGQPGVDQTIDANEQKVAGMSEYLLRTFGADSGEQFSVYVGYYRAQTQGRTIHSPKNCLPGSGWEPTEAEEELLTVGGQQYPVNRYSLVNKTERAVVVYWYQGRGRIAANEYRVKLDLLRDAAFRGRTEEALVRVVVMVTAERSEAAANDLARKVAAELILPLKSVLPT